MLMVMGLAALQARASDGTIVFSEIMYRPSTNESEMEWLELHNLMSIDMDLSGWQLSEGVQFTFPAGTRLRGGGYLVVASSPTRLMSALGIEGVIGPFTGRLSNGGEKLELRNQRGRLIDSVRYSDGPPWPISPDGGGTSLSKRRPADASVSPQSWSASSEMGGTPGRKNFVGDNPPLSSIPWDEGKIKVLVPENDTLLQSWIEPGYDDSSWLTASSAIGFEKATGDTYRDEILSDSPVGFWRLDEVSGTVAFDSSGNGRHGTYVGGYLQNSEGALSGGNQAVQFNGASGYVQLPGTWGNVPAVTVEAWIQTSDPVPPDFQSIIATPDGGFTHFQIHTTGNAGAYTSSGFVALPIPRPLPTAVWRHLAMVISSGHSQIYLNGEPLGPEVTTPFSQILPATFVPNGSRGVRIGNGHQGGRWFRGRLDEVAIYYSALSAERIRAHYVAAGGGGLSSIITTDLAGRMFGHHTGAFLRIPFVIPKADRLADLRLRLQYDDGFIAYLNGQKVASRNVQDRPAGDASAVTNRSRFAARQKEEFSLAARQSLLRDGTNLLTIQGLTHGVLAETFLIRPELVARELDRVDFLRLNEVSGARADVFQLEFIQEGALPLELRGYGIRFSGSGRTWEFPSGVLEPKAHRVVGEREFGFRPAAGEKVFLVTPDGRSIADAIIVTDSDQARVPDATGSWLRSTATSWGQPNPPPKLDQIVINEIMYHPPPRWEEPAEYAESVLFPMEGVWRLDQGGVDLGTAWRAPQYDDSSWAQGAALFHANAAAMPVAKNTPLTVNRRTYYFRTHFEVGDVSLSDDVAAYLFLDDGAVVYLNGNEVLRRNLPGTPVSYSTLASPAVTTASLTGPFSLSKTNLIPGLNTLAVELHRASATDADVVFGLELRARREVKAARPFAESEQGWIELFNRGDQEIDLSGWQIQGGIDYAFPTQSKISSKSYLVIAKDPEALRSRHPGVQVLGPFTNQLSRAGEQIIIQDAQGNRVDDVHYLEGGRWPELADGGGSSLELRDARADNGVPESWAASEERAGVGWRTYSYRGVAEPSFGPDATWREFVLGLIDSGEVLLDDIRVVEDPDGARTQLLINGSFSQGLLGWRLLGNHHGEVMADPDDPANMVLHLTAKGPTEHWSNHAEATLASNRSIANGRVYEISYRARWVGGCPRLNTRLYFNRLARTTRLAMPSDVGTPGRANSRGVNNVGPTYQGLRHWPAVPGPNEQVEISVEASDPDGLSEMRLFWAIDGGAWSSQAMTLDEGSPRSLGTKYRAAIQAGSQGSVTQFYVVGKDGQGVSASFPARGPDSRALFKVGGPDLGAGRSHLVRIAMLPQEAKRLHAADSLMSNDPNPCTVIYDENEVFYDCAVRLRGTCYSRPFDQFVSFSLYFPPDQPFRGVHTSVDIDRSGRGPVGSPGQDEILIKHLLQQAGAIVEYDDLIQLDAPLPQHSSSAMLFLGHHTTQLFESFYPNGGGSPAVELDGAYYPTRTTDGKPDSPKVVEPGPISYTDFTSLGDDPEAYRWNFLFHSQRLRDDYTPVLALARTFDLTGAALDAATQSLLDVNEWMRVFACMSLCGIADAYTMGNPHNLWVYQRPTDGRILPLAHDWDVSFSRPTDASLLGESGNLLKVIRLPGNLRLYYWHLRDLVTRFWNRSYMAPWADRYDDLLPGQDFSGIVNYIAERGAYVLRQLPKDVPFGVTTAGGGPFLTNLTQITIRGSASLDIARVEATTGSSRVICSWITSTNWQAIVPLQFGTNGLSFEAFDHSGQSVAQLGVAVTCTEVAAGVDSDSDGMPDEWERLHGLNPAQADANGDIDRDGLENRSEYWAGTDPQDPQSRLELAADLRQGGVELRFEAKAGRSYTLLERSDVALGNWSRQSDIPPSVNDHPVLVQLPRRAGNRQYFYRLVSPRLP